MENSSNKMDNNNAKRIEVGGDNSFHRIYCTACSGDVSDWKTQSISVKSQISPEPQLSASNKLSLFRSVNIQCGKQQFPSVPYQERFQSVFVANSESPTTMIDPFGNTYGNKNHTNTIDTTKAKLHHEEKSRCYDVMMDSNRNNRNNSNNNKYNDKFDTIPEIGNGTAIPIFREDQCYDSFEIPFRNDDEVMSALVTHQELTPINSSSQRSSLEPLHPSFREEQLTSAHFEPPESCSEASSSSSSSSSSRIETASCTSSFVFTDPVRRCSVAFFDLDDTLIPTDWVRRAFIAARNQQYHSRGSRIESSSRQLSSFSSDGFTSSTFSPGNVSIYEALSPSIQNAVRKQLEELGGQDFDERVASIIEKACLAFGVVVVVTNARSVAWLRIVSDLFPQWKAQLRRFSVPIIRAAVPSSETAALRTEFSSVGEYFQYWTSLKRYQFSRVASATRDILSQLCQGVSLQAPIEANSDYFSDSFPRWLPRIKQTSMSEKTQMFAFRVKGDIELDRNLGEQSLSALPCTPSHLTQLPGGELLLSPRSHGKESHELEDILRKHESYIAFIDDALLMRIIAHQVRRFLLHHHSVSNPELAGLPYSPRSLLSGSPPTFPLTSSYSRYVAGSSSIAPLRPQGQPLHNVPHLPEHLRLEFNTRRARRFHPIASRLRPTVPYQHNGGAPQLDIICVGDSEFELCAARELAIANPGIFRGVGLIKCHPGLPPDSFRDQLDEIEAAMACISVEREDASFQQCEAKQLGPFVSYEFVTRTCGFRTEMLGMSLAEREASRLQRHLSLVPEKGAVKSYPRSPSLATRRGSSPLQSQRFIHTLRARSSSGRAVSRQFSEGNFVSNAQWTKWLPL